MVTEELKEDLGEFSDYSKFDQMDCYFCKQKMSRAIVCTNGKDDASFKNLPPGLSCHMHCYIERLVEDKCKEIMEKKDENEKLK